MLKGAAERLDSALERLGVVHDVKEYPKAGHALLNDAEVGPRLMRPFRVTGMGPHPEAAADAWRRIETFLGRRLSDRVNGKYLVMSGLLGMAPGLAVIALQARRSSRPGSSFPGCWCAGSGWGSSSSRIAVLLLGALVRRPASLPLAGSAAACLVSAYGHDQAHARDDRDDADQTGG